MNYGSFRYSRPGHGRRAITSEAMQPQGSMKPKKHLYSVQKEHLANALAACAVIGLKPSRVFRARGENVEFVLGTSMTELDVDELGVLKLYGSLSPWEEPNE
jgi:hypothetical protein